MHEGTSGEQEIQAQQQSRARAERFYRRQMRSSLSERMVELIGQQEMVFIATADTDGNCDCSPRFGRAGFILVLDDRTLAYPEYRGNGVFASLGNISENPKTDSGVERWILITVDEAYIHCSKHVPSLEKKDKEIRWGTDDREAKSDDYFLKTARRESRKVPGNS